MREAESGVPKRLVAMQPNNPAYTLAEAAEATGVSPGTIPSGDAYDRPAGVPCPVAGDPAGPPRRRWHPGGAGTRRGPTSTR